MPAALMRSMSTVSRTTRSCLSATTTAGASASRRSKPGPRPYPVVALIESSR